MEKKLLKVRNVIYSILLIILLTVTLIIDASAKDITYSNNKKEELKIDNADSWFGVDKFLHFAASASITGLSYHCYHCQFNNPQKNSIYFSVSIAGVCGIGKEFIDKNYRKTGWSWKDIAVDGVGIVAGYLLFIELKK